jgi:hypothetical protein
MIEQLQDMPAGVNGIRISGRVTADDFAQFKPTLDRMMDSDEIRFVEVIGPDYEGFGPGGLLADFKQGFSTLSTFALSSAPRSSATRSGSPTRCTRWAG